MIWPVGIMVLMHEAFGSFLLDRLDLDVTDLEGANGVGGQFFFTHQ